MYSVVLCLYQLNLCNPCKTKYDIPLNKSNSNARIKSLVSTNLMKKKIFQRSLKKSSVWEGSERRHRTHRNTDLLALKGFPFYASVLCSTSIEVIQCIVSLQFSLSEGLTFLKERLKLLHSTSRSCALSFQHS